MNEEEIFLDAIQITSPEERAAYLDQACGNDTPLRARIEALIQSHEQAGEFLQQALTLQYDSKDDLYEIQSLVNPQVRYFGNYEVLGLIARGGMGVVYKVRQTNLNRIVALKTLLAGQLASLEEVQRFHTEAEAAARLDHPNIVPIYEVGEQNKIHFFSMGYIEGESLAQRLTRGPFAPRQAAELMEIIAGAVHYAHGKGVIHRDLKPANVLIDAGGQPRITDFGLARQVDSERSLTGTGQVLGTPGYLAPEQATANSEITPATDVYALGAILYQLLTGRPPFQADNPIDTIYQTINNEPVSPRLLNPKISRDLEAVVLKAISKRPAQRYQTAEDFRSELRRYLEGQPVLTRPVQRWRKAIESDILTKISLPEIICLSGGGALISALFLPIAKFGRDPGMFFQYLPAFVPVLILLSMIGLISSASERYRLTFASSIMIGIMTLFGFVEMRSRITESARSYEGLIERGESGWAEFIGMASWNAGGWLSLATGVLLVFGGSVAGMIRSRDRGEASEPLSVRQFAAAIFSAFLGLSVAVPLFHHAGSFYGGNYDYSVAPLKESQSFVALVLFLSAIACLLTGKRYLRGLSFPGLIAGVAAAVYILNQNDSDFSLTSTGLLSLFGSSGTLIGISLWDYLSPIEDVRDSDRSPDDLSRCSAGAFLFASLIWGFLVLYMLGNGQLSGSILFVACCGWGISFLKFLQKTPVFPKTSRIAQDYQTYSRFFYLLGFVFYLIPLCYLFGIRESDLAMIGTIASSLFLLGVLIENGIRANRLIVLTLSVILSPITVTMMLMIVRDGFQTLNQGFILIGLAALQTWLAWLYRKLPAVHLLK